LTPSRPQPAPQRGQPTTIVHEYLSRRQFAYSDRGGTIATDNCYSQKALATLLLQPDLVVMLAINIINPAFWYNLLTRKTAAITNHLANAKKIMRRNT
jgi:hypothetical protein